MLNATSDVNPQPRIDNAGTVQGPGNVTVSENLDWRSGSLNGSGGQLVVAEHGKASINGPVLWRGPW